MKMSEQLDVVAGTLCKPSNLLQTIPAVVRVSCLTSHLQSRMVVLWVVHDDQLLDCVAAQLQPRLLAAHTNLLGTGRQGGFTKDTALIVGISL